MDLIEDRVSGSKIFTVSILNGCQKKPQWESCWEGNPKELPENLKKPHIVECGLFLMQSTNRGKVINGYLKNNYRK